MRTEILRPHTIHSNQRNDRIVLTRADDTPQVKAFLLCFIVLLYYIFIYYVCQELFLENYILLYIKMYRSLFVKYFYDYQDYIKFTYKTNLRKDLNKSGGFLITLYITLTVVSTLIITLLSGKQINVSNINMVLNSLISISSFFVAGLIYCLFRNIRLSSILPFSKIKPSLLIPICFLGLSLALAANYASTAVLSLFEMFGSDAYIDMSYEPKSGFDIFIYYLSYAVVPAFVEEFAFRGIVLGCIRKHSDSFAVIVSAIMFGLMHGNFMQIPFAFVVGLVLGFVTVKTNSLLPAIIIHFCNNAISVTFDIISSNSGLSIQLINIIYITIMLFIAICGIIGAIILIKRNDNFFKFENSDGLLNFKEKIIMFCKNETMIIFTVLSIIEAIGSLEIGT